MKDDRKMEGKYIAHENVSDMNKCLEDSNHVFFIFLYSSTQPHSKRRVGVASFLPPYRNFQCFKAFVSFKIGEILHKIPGTYEYSFQYVLAPNLSSSFYGLNGETEYSHH